MGEARWVEIAEGLVGLLGPSPGHPCLGGQPCPTPDSSRQILQTCLLTATEALPNYRSTLSASEEPLQAIQ